MAFSPIFQRPFSATFDRRAAAAQNSITLTPVADTWLRQIQPARNYGLTQIYGESDVYLYRFDLSSLSGSCVSVTFSLVATVLRTTNRTAVLYKLAAANSDWLEGVQNNATAGVGDPTWSHKDFGNSVAWAGSAGCQTAGTDYINTSFGTLTYLANTPVPTRVVLTLNASGITAVGGAFGTTLNLMLNCIGGGLTTAMYAREATAENRPQLTILYT